MTLPDGYTRQVRVKRIISPGEGMILSNEGETTKSFSYMTVVWEPYNDLLVNRAANDDLRQSIIGLDEEIKAGITNDREGKPHYDLIQRVNQVNNEMLRGSGELPEGIRNLRLALLDEPRLGDLNFNFGFLGNYLPKTAEDEFALLLPKRIARSTPALFLTNNGHDPVESVDHIRMALRYIRG